MAKFKKQDLLLNFDRIRMDITDFMRGNPITTTAIAIGVPATFGGIATVRSFIKRRKKKSVKSRTSSIKRKVRRTKSKVKRRSSTTRRRTRVTHSKPRHKGHKKVSFTTKDGKRVSFLVKKPSHSHKIRRR